MLVLFVIHSPLMAGTRYSQREAAIRGHLAAFRALPRSVDSYPEDELSDPNRLNRLMADMQDAREEIARAVNFTSCPTGPTHSLPDPTGHS